MSDARSSNPRFPDPEKDLFSDAMDAAASVFHSVRHGILRNAERAGETTDGEVVVRRSIAAAFNAYVRELRLADEPSAGVKCTHCNGKGYNEPIYDEQDGWIDETPCETCNGSGRITTVEQYLKTLPANWHEDSSLETWFPITAEELKRLKDERASQPPTSVRASNEQLAQALRNLRDVAHREVSPRYSAALDKAFTLADIALGEFDSEGDVSREADVGPGGGVRATHATGSAPSKPGAAEPPPAVDVAPIAKLTVRDGLVQRAGLYAPGLPDGDHDVFPVPLSPKGELRPHVLADVIDITCDEDDDEGLCIDCDQPHEMCECRAGEECGRWCNGRLTKHCSKAGSEECDFECPYRNSLTF